MRPVVRLALLAALALPGCAAAAPAATGVAIAPQAATTMAAAAAPTGDALAALDCDQDGQASWREVLEGLLLNNRRVSAEEFKDADLSRDGKLSDGELQRFMNHRNRSAWLLLKTCK